MRIVRIVTIVVLGVLGGYFLVWKLPELSVGRLRAISELQKEQLLLESRKTNAQILGGCALLLGLLFTWRNVRIAEEGHITERFTRAVDQLGSEKIEQRVGAIYALERLASDSRKDHPAIIETICSFLRHRERKAEESEPYKLLVGERKGKSHDLLVKIEKSMGWTPPVPEDVRAAIGLLRRNRQRLRKPHLFDLSGADLRLANLRGARLEGAELNNIHGEKSDFEGASLKGAKLYGAQMKFANLDGANLSGALIEDADFRSALLRGADLRGVKLREEAKYEYGFESDQYIELEEAEVVDFEYADLRDAHVEGVDFTRVNLRGANLSSVKGLTFKQIEKAYGNGKTQLPKGLNLPPAWEKADEDE